MSVDVETRAERVRMALAEAGYGHAWVRMTANGGLLIQRIVPADVAWRAGVLVDRAAMPCRGCYMPHYTNCSLAKAECLAVGTGSLDCGVDRGDR